MSGVFSFYFTVITGFSYIFKLRDGAANSRRSTTREAVITQSWCQRRTSNIWSASYSSIQFSS